MSKLVTIFGGSGFVGRYITRRMAKAGWRVRVAVRRPNEALFVRTYGTVGQVEPIFCNIRDDASVAAALNGADAVVNCVGILTEAGKNTFDEVQSEGAERIARLAALEGISTMVHMSAIGADPEADSKYSHTKALGEAGVAKHMPGAVILRPSIIFGPEDQFFNRFAGMVRTSPVIPLVRANTLFQPVYVDDVVTVSDDEICAGMVVLQQAAKLAVEPAAGAAMAGALGPLRGHLAGRRVGVIVCGANIDTESYLGQLARGQAALESLLS